jgi:hypothetical protein
MTDAALLQLLCGLIGLASPTRAAQLTWEIETATVEDTLAVAPSGRRPHRYFAQ